MKYTTNKKKNIVAGSKVNFKSSKLIVKTPGSVSALLKKLNIKPNEPLTIEKVYDGGYFTIREIPGKWHSRSLILLESPNMDNVPTATTVTPVVPPKMKKEWPRIVGIRPGTHIHAGHVGILRACAQANANIPSQIREYFKTPAKITMAELEFYSKNGLETEIPLTQFNTENAEGFQLDIHKLPPGITNLRFVFDLQPETKVETKTVEENTTNTTPKLVDDSVTTLNAPKIETESK